MEDLKSSRNRSVNKTITTDQVKLYRDSFLPSIKIASRLDFSGSYASCSPETVIYGSSSTSLVDELFKRSRKDLAPNQ
jgi:hypothetical protein